MKSLPLWECGLKYDMAKAFGLAEKVTPLVGVWIEIKGDFTYQRKDHVTPLVGVWIEINVGSTLYLAHKRHSPCGSVD